MLIYPVTAPTIIKIVPKTHPHIANTYGRDSTPAPIATAHKAKILPLTLPYSILPNVLFQYDLCLEPIKGLIGVFLLSLICRSKLS